MDNKLHEEVFHKIVDDHKQHCKHSDNSPEKPDKSTKSKSPMSIQD